MVSKRLTSFMVAGLAALSSPSESRAEEPQYVVRPVVYERLTAAQNHLKKDRFGEAEKQIRIIQKRMKPNPHEQALALQVLGYVYAGADRTTLAVQTLEQSYELKALPASTQHTMLYTMGQLFLAEKKYRKSVEKFDLWLAQAAKPSPNALYTVAAAKYQAKDIRGSIALAARAVKASRNPKDSWLQLLLSGYIETKQYRPAIGVTKTLVERHPERKTGWLQLISLYSEVDDDRSALAVMHLANRAGVLDKREDLVQLAQRYQAQEIHYSAAKMLEESLRQKRLTMDAEVGKLVATSWFGARAHDKAAPALERAGRLSKDGELFFRLAQLEVERERWPAAISAGRKALEKGGLNNTGAVHLLIGIAEARRGRPGPAKAAFERAAKSPRSKRAALGWIKFLSSEQPGGLGAAN